MRQYANNDAHAKNKNDDTLTPEEYPTGWWERTDARTLRRGGQSRLARRRVTHMTLGRRPKRTRSESVES